MSKIDLVIDLQFGSTGKGLLAGYLAEVGSYDTIMTAWAPNAGHTYIDSDGRKYVHTMVANGIVGKSVRRIMVGPGSLLDLNKFQQELESADPNGRVAVYIHPHAAVVTEAHRRAEELTMTGIGSTKKGVGAAAMQKIQRDPNAANVVKNYEEHPLFKLEQVAMVRSPVDWLHVYGMSKKILIEGAQGFGLSIQHGFYPYTTSRDVTPMQILADCGVPFTDSVDVTVFGTARTFPIRVANRFDEMGRMIGHSGPGYADQRELKWSDIGVEPELTTVTRLPRRIFSFSKEQMSFAMDMCSPDEVFLNFVNYVKNRDQFIDIVDHITERGCRMIFGIGPTFHHVYEASSWPGAEKMWDMLQDRMKEGL